MQETQETISGSGGRSPGGGNGNPLQYSYVENSIDRGAWWATVHGLTGLDPTEHTHNTIELCLFNLSTFLTIL